MKRDKTRKFCLAQYTAPEVQQSSCVWVCSSCCVRDHPTSGCKNRNLSSHSSGPWKYPIRVLMGRVSLKAFPFGLGRAVFSPCLPMDFLPCGSVSVSSYMDIGHVGFGPWPKGLDLTLSTSFESLVSKYTHSCFEVQISISEFEGIGEKPFTHKQSCMKSSICPYGVAHALFISYFLRPGSGF